MATTHPPHRPVLLAEVVDALRPRDGGTYLDCTVGAGGHAEAILAASAPHGRVIGIDTDPHALEVAGARLRRFGERVHLARTHYRDIEDVLAEAKVSQVDGALFDLGVSSMQLDQPDRGFSFAASGPLDMRMDPLSPRTAAGLVNTLPERELAQIIFEYGDERWARRIARAIVERRARTPFSSTTDLAETVVLAIPAAARRQKSGVRPLHPATRTFQALRIAVNEELEGLAETLPAAVRALAPGGRLTVISFHSLEDRIVKRFLLDQAGRCTCPPAFPVCRCDARATLRIVTRKPIVPSADEQRENPRSRSAKLRVAEKLAEGGGS